MKKIFKIIGIGIIIFIVGVAGGILANYAIFTNVIPYSIWSQNKIVKGINNNIGVVKTIEKVIVADNESIADIASRTANTVVYIEAIKGDGIKIEGNGVIVSSDGVIVTTIDLTDVKKEKIYVKLNDEVIYTVDNIYLDNYSGITFLHINAENLATISFANSDDAMSGKKLISITRSRSDITPRFALGGFWGRDNIKSIATPISDFLQGVLLVDFQQNILSQSIGSPVIDFQGNMVGLITTDKQNTSNNEFYAIGSNDIAEAFKAFLKQSNEASSENILLGIDYKIIDIIDAYIANREIISGAVVPVAHTFTEQIEFSKSLAAHSGLQGNDIIVMVNNEKVDLKNNLSRLIYKHKDDNQITLDILRAGKQMSINIK